MTKILVTIGYTMLLTRMHLFLVVMKPVQNGFGLI